MPDRITRAPMQGLLVVLAGLVVLHSCWVLLGAPAPSREARRLAAVLTYIPVYGLTSLMLLRVAARLTAQARRAWLLMGAGTLAWTAGQFVYLYLAFVVNARTYPSLADLGYLSLIPCFVLGILLLTPRPASAWQAVTFALDVLIVVTAIGAVLWWTFLAHAVTGFAHEPFAFAIGVAYPVSDFLLCGLLLVMLMWHPRQYTLPYIRLLAAGLFLYLSASIGYEWLGSQGAYYDGMPWDATWMWSALLFALSARAYLASPPARPAGLEAAPPRQSARALNVLPYVGMLVCLLLYALMRGRGDSVESGVTIAAGVVTALVLARQVAWQVERGLLFRRLHERARHDDLTGIPNRAALNEDLPACITQAVTSGTGLAVLLIDLDHFKTINDTCGHAAGDALLQDAALRIQRALPSGGRAYRFGGDEFVVLLPGADSSRAAGAAQGILRALHVPFRSGETEFTITGSVGVTFCPADSTTAATALGNADLAMYEAKRLGKNGVQLFDKSLAVRAHEEFQLASRLHGALEAGEFSLRYQPIVRVPCGRTAGFEALLRWTSPELGNVPPSKFIPVAEERGLIRAIGRWVLREAAQCARAWHDAGHKLYVTVNVSALQFLDEDFVQIVEAALQEHGLGGNALVLEVTESVLMSDAAATGAKLRQLKELGVRVALDDFGTGYSSLTYLQHLPVDIIKLDRSFVGGMHTRPDGLMFLRAVVSFAHNLGLPVVAEGVETPDQFRELQGLACDLAQGYLIARPMPARETADFIRPERSLPGTARHVGPNSPPRDE